jgi:nucleotide-binding universal stress UspA family protein
MTILVATDLSSACRDAADVAAGIARAHGEPLVVVHVTDGPVLPALVERVESEAMRVGQLGLQARAIVEPGDPAPMIADIATRLNASLVVFGARGAGLRDLLGTTATKALRLVGAHVLVVRKPERLEKLVQGKGAYVLACVAYDGKEAVLRDALAYVAKSAPLQVDAAHYRRRPDAPPEGDPVKRLEPLPPRVTATSIIRDGFGRLDAHLSDLAKERGVDLVVCASHRRKGLERLRDGSVSEGIVMHAPVSVLVARAES